VHGAEPLDDMTTPQAERLHIVLVGEARGQAFEQLLREWLEPTGFGVTIAEASTLDTHAVFALDSAPFRIRIWLTLPAPKLARLTLTDPTAERFLVRDVPLERSLDELGREQIAQVLLGAAQAFRERRESTPREEVRRALEPETPAERPAAGENSAAPRFRSPARSSPTEEPAQARFLWAPSLSYAAQSEGPAGVSHTLGGALENAVAWRAARLGLSVGFRYEFPHTATSEEVSLSISAFAY
jgi:hypothetical protein